MAITPSARRKQVNDLTSIINANEQRLQQMLATAQTMDTEMGNVLLAAPVGYLTVKQDIDQDYVDAKAAYDLDPTNDALKIELDHAAFWKQEIAEIASNATTLKAKTAQVRSGLETIVNT